MAESDERETEDRLAVIEISALQLNLTLMIKCSPSETQQAALRRKRGRMTTAEKVFRIKVEVLELGKPLGNLPNGRRMMGPAGRETDQNIEGLPLEHLLLLRVGR
jgi:hypothetical protein